MSKILSRRDVEFLLYEWLDVESLTQRQRFQDHSRETFSAAMDLCEQLATDVFAPLNRLMDVHEPEFNGERVSLPAQASTALQQFCEAGLMSAGQDESLGGMQLPVVVEKACFAWFKGANVSLSGYPFLTIGNANLIQAHGSSAQIERFVIPELAGRFFGTMCLSEPQAGSSLGDIRTRAVPDSACAQDDWQTDPLGARFRLFGNKMWISGGDHELSENIVHLVLAKIPDAEGKLPVGVGGISLFIVPRFLVKPDGSLGPRNDVSLAGLNHKMGYRGTVNTLLNFGEGKYPVASDALGAAQAQPQAGAIGYLIGKPGQGLACMFHMMNEARIGVGLGATMLGYTGYLHALDYARSRPQGRPLGQKDPAAPPVPIIVHADVKRMLLAQKAYVEGAMALNLYCAKLVDDTRTHPDEGARHQAEQLLDLLTPIAKSWPSQWCLEANSLAIQIHGGYGYTRDYPVEQFYRDNRLNPIHEGTHGIQGLDLLGRKMRIDQGALPKLFAKQVMATLAQAQADATDLAPLSAWAQALGQVMQRIGSTTAKLYGAGDPAVTLANSSAYLEAFGHTVLAWVWLEQATLASRKLKALQNQNLADGSEHHFYQGKLMAAQFFFHAELPKVGPMLDLLDSLDTTTLQMQDAWF